MGPLWGWQMEAFSVLAQLVAMQALNDQSMQGDF